MLQQRSTAIQARACKERGNAFFKAGNYPEAIGCYKEAVEYEPWDEAFHLNLSLTYTKLEKWETAVVHADQAIELRWRCVKAWYRKAYAQMQLGIGAPLPEAGPSMIERAWESVRTGIKFKPTDKEMLKLLKEVQKHWNEEQSDKAQLALAAKEELKALEYQEHLEAQEDAQALALLPVWSQRKELAGRVFKTANFGQALELYTEAIALLEADEGLDGLQVDLAALYNNRGACYRAMDQNHETISDCSRTLEIDRTNFKALVRRGLAYEAVEQMQLALMDMKEARALEPSSALVTNAVNRLKEFCKINPDEIDYTVPASDIDDLALFM